ncbi:GH39 family glycosyl hydrolase [Clostridium saccharoperbutylacetonicum]
MKSNLNKENIVTYNIMVKQKEEIHFHQDVELIYVLEGEMELKVEADIFKLKQDDFVVVNPNKKHSYKCSEDILMASFYISFQRLSSFLENSLILFWCNSTIDKDYSYDEVRKIIKLIFNHYLNRKGKEDFYEYSLFYQLVNLLTNNFLINNADERFHDKENKYDDRINEITNYIRGNYNKPISLNDLANQLHLSNAYLSRYLKKHLGMNFIDYLNNVRLHYALEDLLYTEATITRAALDNGFANTAVFNKLFKATYNMTPSAYLKKVKKSIDENVEEVESNEDIILDRLDNHFEEMSKFENNTDLVNDNQYIIVDARDKKDYIKNWNKVINVGAASDLLQSDIQEHVKILKNELKFEYVRFWSVFGHDMYVGVSNTDIKYNFDKIDKVLDFLVDNKIKPFIELGQKPKRLDRTVREAVIFEEEQQLFTNINQWKNVMRAFSIHIVKRYGIEETQNWCFEIWRPEIEDMEVDYLNIFNVGYGELKKYIPNCKVGGAGFRGDYDLKQLMKNIIQWKEQIIQPDFLSFYLYPYIVIKEKGDKYSKRSTDKDYVLNQIKLIKETLKDIKWNVKELYITEWNSTISNRNYTNDSCYKGAYIMKNIIDNINEVDVLAYWIGSDLFSQFYDSHVLLNGGAGLLSKNSIKKPAYYAIEFMNKIGGKIIDKGENYIITANNHNGYYIACHNYKHFNYYYYLKPEDEIKPREQGKIFNDYDNLRLNFQLKNLLNGQYNVKTYSINREHGSALDEWMRMDEIGDLDKDEIDYLKRISTPRLTIKRCDVEEEVLNLEVALAPHEFDIIHISYGGDRLL